MFDTFASVLRYKIWFELWGAKQRSLQAILTIAIGAFAVGAIFGGWQGILADVNSGWAASNPSTTTLKVNPAAPEALLDALGNNAGVTNIEGQMEVPIQWRPDANTEWQPATLTARDDYSAMDLNVLRLEAGEWPTKRVYGVERNFNVALGEQVELRIDANGEVRDYSVPIGGVLYNLAAVSSFRGGTPYFYTTRQRFGDLLGRDAFQKVTVTIADYSNERATSIARQLEDDLADQGYTVEPGGFGNEAIIDPNESPLADTVAGIGFVLQAMGVIAAILGLLLIYNTITAIIAQQTSQIGELKAVGASSTQILVVYFSVVFCYGLIAMLLAVPLGIVAAHGLRSRLIPLLGADLGPLIVATGPVLGQIALCLLAPVAIAAIPISQGARITVREAMSSYGLSSGGSKLDEWLGRLGWLSRAMSLAISNTFRNKQRVLLTQLSLAGAGLTFMAVMSARASLVYSVGDVYYELYRYPIQFSLLEEESDQQIAQAEQVANVGTVEVWQQVDGFVRPAGQPRGVQDEYPQVVGVPVPSDSYAPHILEGRWLEPDDTYAVVMHEQLALNVGVKVGDWVTISIPDDTNSELWRSEQDWQVVGVLFDPSNTSMLMAPRAALASEIGGAGKGNKVQIGTPLAEEPQVADLAVSLRRFFDYRSIDLAASDTDTLGQRSAKFLRNVNTLTTLLVAMAVIVGTVGGIALTGVLSLGVLERRKEIGVLRAIGASPRTILSQFVAEGLMMGWLSWLIALALSYPAGYALATVLGSQLQLSVLFQYSSLGVWLWLALATLIGVVASWSPAQGAIKMSVQESLAYE